MDMESCHEKAQPESERGAALDFFFFFASLFFCQLIIITKTPSQQILDLTLYTLLVNFRLI